MSFSQNLMFLKESFAVSNYAIAKKLRVSQTTIQNWITGKTDPPEKTKEEVAELFGITFDELVGDELPPIRFFGSPKAAPAPNHSESRKKLIEIISNQETFTEEEVDAWLSLLRREKK